MDQETTIISVNTFCRKEKRDAVSVLNIPSGGNENDIAVGTEGSCRSCRRNCPVVKVVEIRTLSPGVDKNITPRYVIAPV